MSRLLESYCDNQISNENRMAVERHLATCRDCELQVRTLRLSHDLLEPVSPPPSLESSVRAAMASAAAKRPKETQVNKTFKFGGLAIGACTIATIALAAYPKKADAHAMYNRMMKSMQSVSSVQIDAIGPAPYTYVCVEGMARQSFPDGAFAIAHGDQLQWYLANGQRNLKAHVIGAMPVPSPDDYVVENIIKSGGFIYGPPQAQEPREVDGQQVQILTRDLINQQMLAVIGKPTHEVIAINGETGLPVAVWNESLDNGEWVRSSGTYKSGHYLVMLDDSRITFNVPVAPGTFDAPK